MGHKPKGQWIWEVLIFLLACISVLTMHCRFEIYLGLDQAPAYLNFLNKLTNTFTAPNFSDLCSLLGVWMIFRIVLKKDKGIDAAAVGLSILLSFVLLCSISFCKWNSAYMLYANNYQVFVSCFNIVGFSVLIYAVVRWLMFLFHRGDLTDEPERESAFAARHFGLLGAGMILLGWLPWILLCYPGSGCPDSAVQLQEFFGRIAWGAGHPPLSTVLMGGLTAFGKGLGNVNFGFFLYCLLQTLFAAMVFPLCMKKLMRLGVPLALCMTGIVFYAFVPLWGIHAQWVEKDLLYAEAATLQMFCMIGICVERKCDRKSAFLLLGSTLAAVFLRNNGIHAVLPTLFLLVLWLKKASRRRLLGVFLTTIIAYELTMKVLFPALNIEKLSPVEALGIPFQQTARYVCEWPEQVTAEEKEALGRLFSYELLFKYDPVISDPIKYAVKSFDTKEYFRVWFSMFWKHPGTYVAAFLNKGYGYLAPVKNGIEAWVQREGDYHPFMAEIGLYHVASDDIIFSMAQISYLITVMPLLKYFCMAGTYTWILVILIFMLIRKKKYSGLILFVPSCMNVLVCLASPLAASLRYELPTVAAIPFLIGWCYYSLHRKEQLDENP